jgi:phosphatidylinositol glycan class N
MVIIGILYLVFEKKILAKSGFKGDSTEPSSDRLSRSLVGVQVITFRPNPRYS